MLGAFLFWECVRVWPMFIDTSCILRLRHFLVRCRRRVGRNCCGRGGGGVSCDDPMNASQCFDRFHRLAHESATTFQDDTHHLRLARLSIFDLLYTLSVDGRHRELYTRLNTKAEDHDVHHEIILPIMIPIDHDVNTSPLMPVKFWGASHEVSLLVPVGAIPGEVCMISLDRGKKRRKEEKFTLSLMQKIELKLFFFSARHQMFSLIFFF